MLQQTTQRKQQGSAQQRTPANWAFTEFNSHAGPITCIGNASSPQTAGMLGIRHHLPPHHLPPHLLVTTLPQQEIPTSLPEWALMQICVAKVVSAKHAIEGR